MGALTSPKTYAGLAVFQAVDAVACAIPVPPIAKTLDTLGVPQNIRWLIPVVESGLGDRIAFRQPVSGVGAADHRHADVVLRARRRRPPSGPRPHRQRRPGRVVPGAFAVLTAKGPDQQSAAGYITIAFKTAGSGYLSS